MLDGLHKLENIVVFLLMDKELKKRAVVRVLREAYDRECRKVKAALLPTVTVRIYAEDLPIECEITYSELGSILLDIEKDKRFKGNIIVDAPAAVRSRQSFLLPDEKEIAQQRIGKSFYDVQITMNAFPEKKRSNTRPEISLERNKWTLSIPNDKKIPMFHKGTLAGELLATLGQTWGVKKMKGDILDELARRVTNQATNGRPTDAQVTNSMKQINVQLKERGCEKRIRIFKDRKGEKQESMHAEWKFILYTPKSGIHLSVNFKRRKHTIA